MPIVTKLAASQLRDKDSRRRLIDSCFRIRQSISYPVKSLKAKDSDIMPDEITQPYTPSVQTIALAACAYIVSGISQPLIMQVCKFAGLANSSAQLYMLAYYAGPACLIFTLCGDKDSVDFKSSLPPLRLALKASCIAMFDICAQSLNYTGASLAGATIFAVIYSSVTIWTAVFSRIILKRSLSWWQWFAVVVVFGGLSITALDSVNLGPDVAHGTILIVFGSCMHGSTYVLSEGIMTGSEPLTPRQNSAIQGLVAWLGLSFWTIIYTLPRWETLIGEPARAAGTTVFRAFCIMLAFAVANLVHSFSFYHTLKHYPGGSTSAGVMKGLQAVLVFVVAHFVYCGRSGGEGMCFSFLKFISLVTVVGGVMIFGFAKEHRSDVSVGSSINGIKQGYTPIRGEADVGEVELEGEAPAGAREGKNVV